jgi:phosphate butyryltransferase
MWAPIVSIDEMLREARGLEGAVTAAVVATDAHVLEVALLAAQQGLITPIFIGRPDEVRSACGPSACQYPILTAQTAEQAALMGVQEVKQGRAHMLIKGHLHTSEFLHPILAELRQAERLSHVFVGQVKGYPKLLYITDAAMNIAPDLVTKVAIVNNAVKLARAMGIERPKVAAISAIETINTAIPSTLDAACLAKMAERGQLEHVILDGPLALDDAISAEASRIKGINSPVPGDVDILLMPDLVSGNALYKAITYFAGARFAGIVLGASVPVVLASRADTIETHLASIALARVAHERMHQIPT